MGLGNYCGFGRYRPFPSHGLQALEGVEELAEGLERDFYDSHRQLVNMERATERAVPVQASPAVGDAAADAE